MVAIDNSPQNLTIQITDSCKSQKLAVVKSVKFYDRSKFISTSADDGLLWHITNTRPSRRGLSRARVKLVQYGVAPNGFESMTMHPKDISSIDEVFVYVTARKAGELTIKLSE